MDDIFVSLLILMLAVWIVAVTLRPLGIPTVMGELIVGVLVGPAVFGWIEPNELIQALAEIGIFFLMLHAGVETEPREFFSALKKSMGVATVGALVPFAVSFGVAQLFGLSVLSSVFVALTMTATAVVITLRILQDLGLQNTRFARIIIASCVIDDLLTLIVFGVVLGVVNSGSVDPMSILQTIGKVIFFFGVSISVGYYLYPYLKLPFHTRGGKGFTFVLVTALAAGIFAHAIGLHVILGAYMAGLFFEHRIANPRLFAVVKDRLYAIAFSFLGPIFFISLGFNITFDLGGWSGVAFLVILTLAVTVGQILSAGAMALRLNLSWIESFTVGVGMCGRAEMAFILASLAYTQNIIDKAVFSILIFTAFLLNLITPTLLKVCAMLLKKEAQQEQQNGLVVNRNDKDSKGTEQLEL